MVCHLEIKILGDFLKCMAEWTVTDRHEQERRQVLARLSIPRMDVRAYE